MYKYYELDKKLISCTPSERQLRHNKMEFYAFVHFSVNTFTDKEWGDGTEDEALFNPLALDAEQWALACKSAGMTGLILTAKHHDGFCLWPSKYTEHSVKNSPFREGGGDVVREAAQACKKHGLKFGVYLSPWDRNSPVYGLGKAYDDYFCNQLRELLTEYGELFCVWFDGACGEGPNGKKQIYDWDRYYALIRELQPEACISISGPDVRWCGNESGATRDSEWSVIPASFDSNESVAENSQQNEDDAPMKINESDMNIGSRSLLRNAASLQWKHSEVDVSIRPGWFYHKSENKKLKSLKKLSDIYIRSVGGNSTLLLNIPPDTNGLFAAGDVQRLAQLGSVISKAFSENLLEGAKISADIDDGTNTADNLFTDSYSSYYAAPEKHNTAVITIELPEIKKIKYVVLKENIEFSQRIESFNIEYRSGKGWRKIYQGTTVGYKKIARFRPVMTNMLRINITDSRVCPVLSHIALY